MHLCPECGRQLAERHADPGGFTPLGTVAGGAAGVLAGLLTGAVLLAPVALLIGAAVDLRRCGMCGREIGDEEQAFHLPVEQADPLGGQVSRPAGREDFMGSAQQVTSPPARPAGNRPSPGPDLSSQPSAPRPPSQPNSPAPAEPLSP